MKNLANKPIIFDKNSVHTQTLDFVSRTSNLLYKKFGPNCLSNNSLIVRKMLSQSNQGEMQKYI